MSEAPSEAVSRAEAMSERVVTTALATGTPLLDLDLLARAHELAMRPRLLSLPDAHDPDLLHPGRTALILLIDMAETRPAVLAAAMVTETGRPDLKVDASGIEAALGPGAAPAVAELAGAVPDPAAEDLAEQLVIAPEEVQRIALAERLDHLRHAHLWTDRARQRAAHDVALRIYAPVAERVHPTMARRYAWWCGMFERKYLR